MAILSDSDILRILEEGTLKIGGFTEANLTPNGYDVTVDEVWIPATDERTRDGVAVIPPREWFVIGTRESIEMPSDIVGGIWIRTTWARKGVLSSFGRIDAGFHGNLTFSAYNASGTPVELPVGERFAQVVFEELVSPATKGYKDRSGNYHGQKGITLEPNNDHRNDRSNA